MRKLKTLFTKDKKQTEKMKKFFYKNADTKDYVFIGVYHYKDYEIFFDHIPDKGQILKHISLRNKDFKEIEQKDLELIINHFIGENYSVQYGILNKNIINVYEEKVDF